MNNVWLIAGGVALLASALLCVRIASLKLRSLRDAVLDIINGMPNGMIVGTARAGEVTCNTEVIRSLGLLSDRALSPQSFRVDAHPVLRLLCEGMEDQAAVREIEPVEIIDDRGRYRRLECHYTACRFGGQTLPMILLIDRTDREEATMLLEQSRMHDPLTGLVNREIFHDRFTLALEQAARGSGTVAVLSIKVDQFETVLERHGWDAAKQLLTDVAMRLGANARAMDTVARVGQNRFAVILTAMNGAGLTARIADRFRDAVRGLFHADQESGPISITGSVGIALSGIDGSTSLRLLEHAGLACSRARAAGGDRTLFYNQDHDIHLPIDSALIEEIRHGLDQGQFFVEYQPIMDVASRRISGFEALLRWRHPRRGLVPPTEFIGAAERSGLITTIGDFVLATACLDASTWPYDIDVSVNASVVQLLGGGFAQRVALALAHAGLAPSRLKIEITETAAIPSIDDLSHATGELRRMGVAIMLDDFGTGYSSLSQLCSLAFDGLKIERQFVNDLDNPRTLAIVEMLVTYCRNVGLMIVAEGVETGAQLALLEQVGCTHVQGFLLGRPMIGADAREILYRYQDQH